MRADETLYDLLEEIDGVRKQDGQAGRPPSVVLRKLDRALDEFATYVDNKMPVPSSTTGSRYRCGERIATGFVESAVRTADIPNVSGGIPSRTDTMLRSWVCERSHQRRSTLGPSRE